MSMERNIRGGKEPLYQNYPFRNPTLPASGHTLLYAPIASITPEQTIPIWKVKGDAEERTISSTDRNVVTHCRSNQASGCTGKCSPSNSNASSLNRSCTKPGANVSGLPGSSDSSSSGGDSVQLPPLPVYDYPPPPRRIPINDRVPHLHGVIPPVVVTSADELEQPPDIPIRRSVMLSPEQTELFSRVPPPSIRSKGFSSSGPQDIRSFTPTNRSGHSTPSALLNLTDSVPPLPLKRSALGDVGYVPPKPGLNLPFPLNENGYLKMHKEPAADSHLPEAVSPRDSRPPFENLWNQDMNADDPEYFSMSDLYADEPLYQVYHRDAVVRDVLEQNMEDEDDDVEYEDYSTVLTSMLKRTSERRIGETCQMDLMTTVENLLPLGPGLRRYWSDTAQVKKSGLLDRLSSQERKHQECIFEIITSEASYLKSLKLLETHFMESPYFKPPASMILSRNDYVHLFSNVKNIIAVSNRMLQELEMIWKQNVVLDGGKICRTLKTVAEHDYEVYIPYLANATFQERKLAELCARSEFRSRLTDLEDDSVVNGLKLQSFLVLPMQRITRVPLLVDAVLRGLSLTDPGVDDVNECLTVFQKILTECNEKARQMENIEQLNELSRLLQFKKSVRTIPIVSQNRRLIKKGPLVHIKLTDKPSGAMSNRFMKTIQKKVLKDRSKKHFFLFNDLLLIAQKKGNHFEVTKSMVKRDIVVLIIDEYNVETYLPGGAPDGCNFLFCLEVFEEDTKMVLSCDSENERMRWIEACDPSHQNEQDEAVYEITDCPQVQTIQRFVPSEPDELALEASDIVDVLRKTQDGWYEGQRIRDGRRGWFKANHTIEIENAHKRAKNRRQQWRLLKQTQTFQCQGLHLTT